METKKMVKYQWGLLISIGLLFVVIFSKPIIVQANPKYHVDYTILDLRTQKVSPFDKFFVKPAQVTRQRDGYQIMMTTKLLANLNLNKLQALVVNGQQIKLTKLSPYLNVSAYQFEFKTTNLANRSLVFVQIVGQNEKIYANIKWGANNVPKFNVNYADKQTQSLINNQALKAVPNDGPKVANTKKITTGKHANFTTTKATTSKNNKPIITQQEKAKVTRINKKSDTKNVLTNKNKLKSKRGIALNPVFLTSIGILFAVVAVGYWRSMGHK